MRTPFTLMTVASTSTRSVSVSGFDDIGRLTPRVRPVRQSSALPAASFRSHLTVDTLAVRLAVPLTGSAEDFHFLGVRPAGRTNKKSRERLKSFTASPNLPLFFVSGDRQ